MERKWIRESEPWKNAMVLIVTHGGCVTTAHAAKIQHIVSHYIPMIEELKENIVYRQHGKPLEREAKPAEHSPAFFSSNKAKKKSSTYVKVFPLPVWP